MAQKQSKIIVIGSGVAGLAAAIRLAAAGNEVQIIEANSYPGGKLSEFEISGFRFDAGPSLFTLPHLVEELLLLAGKNPKECFPYRKLEKGCHYFYEDGTKLIAYADPNKFSEEIERKLGVSAGIIKQYLKMAKLRYEITAPLFLEYSLHKLKNYTRFATLRGIFNILKLNLFEPMHAENKRILKHPHLVQYFNRFATYNGSNPYLAPALLNMIPHLEHHIGTYFPVRGMHQITETLYQTALELGVTFHFNEKVEEIILEGDKVCGVRSAKTSYIADKVISNMDIHPTYKNLLRKVEAPKRLLVQEKSSSALIFYWGIKHSFPELDLHNIFFSADYEKEFETIFKEEKLFLDPTIYINITSKYNTSDAPAGSENWFVMINTPNNTGQDWDEWIGVTREKIIEKLERILGKSIREHIVCEQVLDPRSIESKTSSFRGSLYGNASNNRYAAFLRHANFHSKIKGLYFCGGSVHPGGGIPLCLNSGKIVAQLISEGN
jgi:phytoene desaturase